MMKAIKTIYWKIKCKKLFCLGAGLLFMAALPLTMAHAGGNTCAASYEFQASYFGEGETLVSVNSCAGASITWKLTCKDATVNKCQISTDASGSATTSLLKEPAIYCDNDPVESLEVTVHNSIAGGPSVTCTTQPKGEIVFNVVAKSGDDSFSLVLPN